MDKLPLFLVVIVIVFLITSVITFVAMDKGTEDEVEVALQKEPGVGNGEVAIRIVNPNENEEGEHDGTNI